MFEDDLQAGGGSSIQLVSNHGLPLTFTTTRRLVLPCRRAAFYTASFQYTGLQHTTVLTPSGPSRPAPSSSSSSTTVPSPIPALPSFRSSSSASPSLSSRRYVFKPHKIYSMIADTACRTSEPMFPASTRFPPASYTSFPARPRQQIQLLRTQLALQGKFPRRCRTAVSPSSLLFDYQYSQS